MRKPIPTYLSGCRAEIGTGIAFGMIIALPPTTDDVCTQGLEKQEVAKVDNIVELLEAGIRAESLRQKAIASNIANLETPGYRRIDVKFERSLAKALSSGRPVNIREIEPLLYRPEQTPLKSNGNDVSLEAEVGQMVKNTLRHKAYVRLLEKKYRQIELAIRAQY
jgi:flagellar basal-body rod protein FlgB